MTLICEIFLFHLHSKSTTYLTAKEFEFDVKLPTGFYAVKDVNSESNIKMDRFNSNEDSGLNQGKENKKSSQADVSTASEEIEVDKENLHEPKKKTVSK